LAAERDPDAYALALQALGRKERTEAELADWLREHGVEEIEVAEVVGRLIESGGLDDERFARRFAEDKRELAGWGPERIREALLARGVAAEDVEAALADEDEGIQIDRAFAALNERKMSCDSESERARALAFLARRGFPLEVGYDAVRRCERHAA
jgi:regulatory protein